MKINSNKGNALVNYSLEHGQQFHDLVSINRKTLAINFFSRFFNYHCTCIFLNYN